MAICNRCGRANPEQLTFCQDCGNRLTEGAPPPGPGAPVPPGGMEPTPPRGVPVNAGDYGAPPDDGGGGVRSRPPAPDFQFAPKQAEVARCERCGHGNPPTHRFCAECGAPLAAATAAEAAPAQPAAAPVQPAAAPAQQAAAPPRADYGPPAAAAAPAYGPPPAPAPPPGPAPHAPALSALAAAPVVELKAAEQPAAARVMCTRCKGINTAAMRFCKFCGARLEETGQPLPPVRTVQEDRVRTAPESPQAFSAPAVQPDPVATAPQAAPAAAAVPLAKLVVIAQDGTPGREYPLHSEQTDIGRTEGDIVLPGDGYLSARHARMTLRDGRFYVKDLESLNGVYARLRRPKLLQDGDLVLIGLEVLRFEAVSDAEKGLGPATERGAQVFGSPAAPRFARLCQRTVEGVTRDVFHITRDETTIGRESGDIVFSTDPFMSRRHAAIVRNPGDGTFTLKDLGSSNGTYLRIHREQELVDGDHLRIGQHLFRFERGHGGR